VDGLRGRADRRSLRHPAVATKSRGDGNVEGCPDDRLYTAERPGRRDLAIVLLIDVSASTDAWIGGARRIIDVEKEALIAVREALDALGDPHAVLAFSGQAPRTSGSSRSRASAAALLGAQRARRRLLLVLSDGRPNDVDQYEGRYGIEDTRQAVAEARLLGAVPFCLTVDREAPAYLSSLFGPRGFAVLRTPEHLPAALIGVVRVSILASMLVIGRNRPTSRSLTGCIEPRCRQGVSGCMGPPCCSFTPSRLCLSGSVFLFSSARFWSRDRARRSASCLSASRCSRARSGRDGVWTGWFGGAGFFGSFGGESCCWARAALEIREAAPARITVLFRKVISDLLDASIAPAAPGMRARRHRRTVFVRARGATC